MKQKKYQKINKPTQLSNKTKQEIILFKSFDNFINKYGFYFLLSIIALIVFFVFKDFILLKKLYLFKDIGSDSMNIAYPHLIHVSDYLKSDGFPKWSFNQGMGQNIFPSFSEPFGSFLFFIGRENIGYGMAYMEVLKIFLAGVFFYLFLKKISLSEYSAIIGGILYSFSSFVIIGSCWNIFSIEAIYLALLLFSYEKLKQDNKWLLFPIVIALITILQPFDLYLYGLFLFIYIIFSFFEENGWQFKKLFLLLLKVAGLGLLGVAISSFFLIGNILQMIDSPRVEGDSSYFNILMSKPLFGFESDRYGKGHYITAIMRLFSGDMLGTGTNFKGWYNYLEAPLFYCGLINLLLVPQLFAFLDKKRKILYSLLLVIFIVPIIFPYFRYSYWLFTGDYYRAFSLLVAFIILLFSIKSLNYINKNSKVNFIIILITLAILLIILYYPYEYLQNNKILNKNLRDTAAVFLIIYAFLIYFLKSKKVKNIIQLLLIFLVLIELSYFSSISITKRPVITSNETKQKIGYNDYTNDAVAYLNKSDSSFYRINKDYFSGLSMHSSINDGKVQKYKGTTSYSSFNQLNYIKFLQELGIIKGENESQTRWAPGLIGSPFLHSFASIKYAFSKTNKPDILNFNYDSLTTIGNVKIFKNRFALPLGFTYEKYITLKDFKKLTQNQKMFTLYKAVVINDSIYKDFGNLTKFNLCDTSKNYSWNEYADDIKLCNYSGCKLAIVLKAVKIFWPFLIQVSVIDLIIAYV